MKVKFQGNEVTLVGEQLKVGDTFPEFKASNNSLEEVALKDTKGVRIFLTVPSLDTPVCDLEVRTFNEKASKIEGVTVYTLSMDLPFAQARWCGAAEVENVITLSDYKDRAFGKVTGTYVKELGLLARTSFVVGSDNKITYVDYLNEITNYPNYDEILEAAKKGK
ncbi:thiol peroxidase, atypical 2-Cys peroxiredoxin [Clostridium acidisoli DSM 12555]|uniref:Thiol peroxidase, atypical 2-Cys peroxiredoxin n=1 Tax=Clostridium acidisoli DSM 12555 TaxID=1121291 RepID=A0A1W1XBU8_9CLOT|nr:thiol peroxidase [Clostridium acidisoli]SMC21343.1 thiol peroxidase, atypical 2-Cys peroxiredoxin [Clostridium acidisoli DSM 12555]